MFDFTISGEEGGTPVLVEFAPQAGVRQVGIDLTDPKALAEKSAHALNVAMGTIRAMAERVTATIDGISDKPTEVSVEFGLKLDAEAGAYIAKASAEAGFTVTLTWKK
ncbi:MAG TPA: CU044_2847 family protein [Anaerolineae bacterium]|nr:CU044_2847 family protein [Anaerolineae bacterium]